MLDDIASQLAFEERWTRFVDELLDDPALERTLLLALNADTTLTVLRTLALACNANWDLVAERMGPEPDPPPLDAALAPVLVALAELHELAGALPGGRRQAARDCSATSPTWHDELARRARRVRAAAPPHRGHAEGQRSRQGRKDNWPDDVPGRRRCATG